MYTQWYNNWSNHMLSKYISRVLLFATGVTQWLCSFRPHRFVVLVFTLDLFYHTCQGFTTVLLFGCLMVIPFGAIRNCFNIFIYLYKHRPLEDHAKRILDVRFSQASSHTSFILSLCIFFVSSVFIFTEILNELVQCLSLSESKPKRLCLHLLDGVKVIYLSHASFLSLETKRATTKSGIPAPN